MLDYLLSGTNCVCVLPIGYRKSLPYQMYITLLRMMHDRIFNICSTVIEHLIQIPLYASLSVDKKVGQNYAFHNLTSTFI